MYNGVFFTKLYGNRVAMRSIIYTFFSLALSLCLLGASSASAQSQISVTAGMQSCNKHADCALVATSCLKACSYTPVNKAAMSNINARYRDYCGFSANERPVCNITPPLEATCENNLCTLVQARTLSGYGNAYQQSHARARTPSYEPTPQYRQRPPMDKSGQFTAYDLPTEIVNKNIMGQYRFEPSRIEPAAGN